MSGESRPEGDRAGDAEVPVTRGARDRRRMYQTSV